MRHGARTTLWRLACTCAVLAGTVAQAAAQAPAAGDTVGRDTLATVYGTVVAHADSTPLAEATVSLASGPQGTRGMGTRVTDQEGAFLFRDVPPGTYTLVVGLLGYLTRTDTVHVDAGGEVQLVAELSVSAVPLEPIQVVVRRPLSDVMEGFRRRRTTTGGSFITRQEIEERHPTNLSDILRTVPGVQVLHAASGDRVRLRGGCQPALWVDGSPTTTAVSMDMIVLPTNVEGIEIYRGPEVPARFSGNPCGAIVVWTRRPARSTVKGSIRKPLLITVGILLVGYLLTG